LVPFSPSALLPFIVQRRNVRNGSEAVSAQNAFGSPASFNIWFAMCRLFVRGTAKVLPVAG
jgi:hypothetical protein